MPSPLRLRLLLLVLAAAPAVRAQPVPADTAGARTDTLAPPPTGVPPAPAAEGGPEEPVAYTARDSMIVVLAPRDSLEEGAAPDDRVALYGAVEARYGEATLTAGAVEIALGREEARARRGAAGEAGTPRFAEGAEGFSGREIVYNFRTRRGRVVGARTEIEGGFLLGGVVKQVAPDVVYAADAGYTTCDNPDHPHYQLVASRLMVDGDYVYSGPVQLRILGVPLPLWLPFGYFPAREGRRSGPLPPGYGDDPVFGLFLENLGWYWAASDYFDLLGKVKLGTLGSVQADVATNYVRRYRYDGALTASFARLRRGERDDPDFTLSDNARLMWRHQQTFSPEARLSAAVDLSSSAQRFLSDRYDDRVAQTTTSTVSFARSWPRAGRQLGLDLRATQQLSTGGIDATFPSLSFSQQRLFPFRRGAAAGGRWYEQISVSYAGSATNTYRFAPLPDSLRPGFENVSWIDALFNPDAFTGATGQPFRFTPQATHSVPVSAAYSVGRLPLLGPIRLALSPSVRYSESWYGRSEGRALDSTGAVVRTDVPGFTAIRRVSAGVSASTEAYGTFPFRLGPLRGLRHVLRPQAALEFEPDYGAFGYVRSITDTTGREVRFPIVAGVPVRRTARLGFSLANVLQTRRVRPDSTAEGGERRETIQLLALNLRSAYDFAAEERPLADLAFDLTSELGEKFRLRLDGAASAYALDSLGRPTPRTYFSETGFPLRPTRFSAAFGTAFRARARRSDPSPLPAGYGTAASPVGLGDPLTGADPLGLGAGAAPPGAGDLGVVDRGVPWAVALDLTYSYSPAVGVAPARHEAVLGVSRFEVGLPLGLHLSGASGFDLVRFRPATTQLQLVKDLHCWEARLSVVPFGDFRQVGFSIYVKSGFLRDLLRLDFAQGGVRSPFGGL